MDYGSSYLPSDLNAAYLWAQLEMAEEINDDRLSTWNYYYEQLKILEEKGYVELPYIPEECEHNAHMFYLKLKNLDERTKFIEYMKENDVYCVFHYIPLHSAQAGIKFGRFDGKDEFTTRESERLVRIPLWYGMKDTVLQHVVKVIKAYWKEKEGCQ